MMKYAYTHLMHTLIIWLRRAQERSDFNIEMLYSRLLNLSNPIIKLTRDQREVLKLM